MKIQKKVVMFCIGILLILFFAVICKAVIKNVFFEKCGVDNSFIAMVLHDDNDYNNVKKNSNGTSRLVIDWEKQYPFAENDSMGKSEAMEQLPEDESFTTKIKSKVYDAEGKIEWYTNTGLPLQVKFVEAASAFEKALGLEGNITESNGIVFLNNDYLVTITPKAEQAQISDVAKSVNEFNEFLSSQRVEFVYVNAGNKICKDDKQLPEGVDDYSNENNDKLLKMLENVDIIDVRDAINMTGLNHYDFFYRTDHHWKTSTGLWVAQIIADHLNKKYEYAFDKALFDASNYDSFLFRQWLLGSQGRTVTLSKTKPEDFEFLIPKTEKRFKIEIPTRNISREGDFKQVFIDDVPLKEINYYGSSAYESWTIKNDAVDYIDNIGVTNNPGKKILVIQDSFGWCVTPYLALDVEHIDVIYPPEFTGSIRSFIERTKPDIVILFATSNTEQGIDWSKHTSFMDLR